MKAPLTTTLHFRDKALVAAEAEVPHSILALEQNAPNPFSTTTLIRYSIPAQTQVRLSLFDTLGRQVAMLVNEVQSPGEHRVSFDGSSLASGVYVCRLEADGQQTDRKITIVR